MTIDEIREAISADDTNSVHTSLGWKPLFAASARSRVLIVGQAPGRRAQEAGIPWHDASGKRLTGWLGVTDEEFHDDRNFAILPMDFFYPGKASSGDLPPRKGVAARWHPLLLAAMPEIRLTILVGRYAQAFYLRNLARASLTETVRAWRDYLPRYFPIVHPSPLNVGWHQRNPWFEEQLVPALREQVSRTLTGGPNGSPAALLR